MGTGFLFKYTLLYLLDLQFAEAIKDEPDLFLLVG